MPFHVGATLSVAHAVQWCGALHLAVNISVPTPYVARNIIFIFIHQYFIFQFTFKGNLNCFNPINFTILILIKLLLNSPHFPCVG